MTIHNFRNRREITVCLIVALSLFMMQDVFLFGVVHAQTQAHEYLEMGIRQYKNAEFINAARSLQQAILLGLSKSEQAIQAHQYLAFCFAVLDDSPNAKVEYLKILQIDPSFTLPLSESPRLREPFEDALREFEAMDRRPPAISFTPPAAADENTALSITADVTDASAIASVRLFYKKASDSRYRELGMSRETGSRYAALIPAEEITLGAVEIYIEATDEVGNEPAHSGNPENPFKIPVRMIDREPPAIVHVPVAGTQENTDIPIDMRITDRSGVKEAWLFYRTTNEAMYYKQALKEQAGDRFSAIILAEVVKSPGVEYYLQAFDRAENAPAFMGSENDPLRIAVSVVDNQPPVIQHEAIAQALENAALQIGAIVTDASGVEEVDLYYRKADEIGFQKVEMTAGAGGRYEAEIPGETVSPPGIAYYIEAKDAAGNDPSFSGTPGDPLTVRVTVLDREPPVITHLPVGEAQDKAFIVIQAGVTDNTGVSDVTLHYRAKGEDRYRSLRMREKEKETYQTVIQIDAKGMEYYLEARDVSGNQPAFWKSPAEPQAIRITSPAPVAATEEKPAPAAGVAARKGGKKWLLWVGLAVAATAGGLAVVLSGGEKEEIPAPVSILMDPPADPSN